MFVRQDAIKSIVRNNNSSTLSKKEHESPIVAKSTQTECSTVDHIIWMG